MRQATSRQPVGELGQLLIWGAAVLSSGAGVIHLSAASEHFEVSLAHGLFFIVVAGLQLLWAGLIVRRPTSLLLTVGALGNGAVAATWLISRTSGIPFGPGAGIPEPIGLTDGLATAFELLIIGAGASLLFRRPTPAEGPPSFLKARPALVGVASIVFLLTALTFTPLASQGPAHGHSKSSHGDEVVHSHDDKVAHGRLASGDHGADDKHAADHSHSDASQGALAGSLAPGHGHAGPHRATARHSQAGAPRGHPASSHSQAGPALPSGGSTGARPAVLGNPGDLRTTVRYGPFLLPPSSLGGSNIPHFNRILTNVAKPCSDCYITGMVPDLVYEDGTSANLDTGPMLHHAVWMQRGKADATCGDESATLLGPFSGPLTGGERFFAAGNERTGGLLPQGFGYYVSSNPMDVWSMVVELMNYSEASRMVYITLDATYRPAAKGEMKKVTPLWLDQKNCGTSEYSIPAGPYQSEWRWVSNLTGRMIATFGHVHDGGIKTVLANSATGREICSSVAGYGTKPAYMGSIESMSGCVWDSVGTMRAGETLTMITYYNSTVPADNVMGIMLAYVYETTDLDGGTAPPASATQAPEDPTPPPPAAHHH